MQSVHLALQTPDLLLSLVMQTKNLQSVLTPHPHIGAQSLSLLALLLSMLALQTHSLRLVPQIQTPVARARIAVPDCFPLPTGRPASGAGGSGVDAATLVGFFDTLDTLHRTADVVAAFTVVARRRCASVHSKLCHACSYWCVLRGGGLLRERKGERQRGSEGAREKER